MTTSSKQQKGYPRVCVKRKTGAEKFLGSSASGTMLNFWQWSTSDLVNNSTRGVLAEYIVAIALGIAKGVRESWKAYDLDYKGKKIEVKSAAYLQSWFHRELSKITFSIRATRNWDAETNVQSKEEERRADIYIFCVLDYKDKESVDPMNLDQWMFYILPVEIFEREPKYKNLKSVGLKRLLTLNPREVHFGEIKHAIDELCRKT
jgi:hypothetical protein